MFGISLARISLLTGTSLGGGVGVSPTLDLNFRGQGYSAAMAGYTFNQLIDFTRTSAATYVDATGKIVPTPASRNLLTFTQEFDNAAWTKTNATVYPFDPATATQGPELVTNGGFDSASGWTLGGGWSISGGDLVGSAVTGTAAAQQTITTGAGKWFALTFTVKTVSGGQVSLGLGSALGTPRSAPGTYTEYFQGTGATNNVAIYQRVSDFTGTVDNVSVKEVIGGLIAAPDGTLTADKLVENTANTVHYVERVPGLSVGTVYTFSFYAKAGERTWCNAFIGSGAYFDLANGVVGAISTGFTASITSAGNGWYRCAITGPATSASNGCGVAPALANNSVSYTGTAGSGIYLWGAQLEAVPDANLVLGSERVTNGGFADATGWTLTSGWAISGGQATFTANSTNAAITSVATSAATAGKTYRVEYTVVANTLNAGNLRVGGFSGNSFFGGTLANIPTTVGTNVAYITVATPSGTGTVLDFWVSNAATSGAISIDNISVKEITAITGMPTDYTRNNGGVYPPRFDYDPVTLAPKGLLVEEQRTNLLTYSEQFDSAAWTKTATSVTANATTSPDGTVDADKVIENTATSVHRVVQNATIVSGTVYTFSAFVKAAERTRFALRLSDGSSTFARGFDLSSQTSFATTSGETAPTSWTLTDAGGGWFRASVTATSAGTNGGGQICLVNAGTNTSYTGDGTSGIYIWGAQLEAGAFATSYIPTVASQVTRTADVATITGANFSQWYNQSAGTFVVEASKYVASGDGYLTTADSGSIANFVGAGVTGTTGFLNITTGGVAQAFQTAGAITANNIFKLAAAAATNDAIVAVNGAISAGDTVVTMPTPDRLRLGASASGGTILNGHIRSIKYFPTRLSNTQLQALTV